MEKKITSMLWYFLAVLVFLNLLVFVIPFSRGMTFWIAYVFLMTALVAQFGIYYLISHTGDLLKKGAVHYPLLRIGYRYLIIQLVVSIIFFLADGFLSPSLVWIPLAVCLLIFGISCGLFVMTYSSLKTVERIHETTVASTAFIQNLTLEADLLRRQTESPVLQEKLSQFYEIVRFSDPVSSPGLSEIEERIGGQMQVLKSVVACGDAVQAEQILQQLSSELYERNQRCKMLK